MHELLYQDKWITAVNKPHDMLCVPGLREKRNLYDELKVDFPNLRIVHRLDMATSGVMLFAQSYEAQKALGQLFEKRKMDKRYLALAQGRMMADLGEIHAPLSADWPNRPRQQVDWLKGKSASTFFQTQGYDTAHDYSKLILRPRSGRTHQLRVHLWHIGRPILGDNLYYHHESQFRAKRLCLHAHSLAFEHPMTGQQMYIKADAQFDQWL